MEIAFAAIAAALLDLWFGEPRQAHPLSYFGRLTERVATLLDRPGRRYLRGSGALLLLVVPFAALVGWLATLPSIGPLLATLILFLGLGTTGLLLHGRQLEAELSAGQLEAARARLALLVDDPPPELTCAALSRAAVRALLRQAGEGVFAVLFWFLVAGPGGVVALRLSQQLADHYGTRGIFGLPARHLLRLLQYLPERLAALTYLILGDSVSGWRRWRRHANGVSDLAATVGVAALGVEQVALPLDVGRAVGVVRYGLWGWLALILLVALAGK